MKIMKKIKMGGAREEGKRKVLSQWVLEVDFTSFIIYAKLDPIQPTQDSPSPTDHMSELVTA